MIEKNGRIFKKRDKKCESYGININDLCLWVITPKELKEFLVLFYSHGPFFFF